MLLAKPPHRTTPALHFEFATATRIIFGPGSRDQIPAAARQLGRHGLVVTGRTPGRSETLVAALAEQGIQCSPFRVPAEPTTDLVQSGAEHARARHCDMLIAIGGGSVLDAAKAIAALAANPGSVMDYLEVIGKGRPLLIPSLPWIAVPTTAGTGTEVTRNSVLTSIAHRVKASLRSPGLLASLAVIDPELTLGLPRHLTATTGLDALTQLIEPLVSCRANPLVDGFCREGLVRVARSLERACEVPADLEARQDMALASLFSGLALANAALGAVHGFAAPLGGMFQAPHGAVCAALLPTVVEVNVRALQQRQPSSPALSRYAEIARTLTQRSDATAGDAGGWVRDLCGRLGVMSLAHYGVTRSHVPELCAKAAQASSMKGNPLPLQPDELEEILNRSL